MVVIEQEVAVHVFAHATGKPHEIPETVTTLWSRFVTRLQLTDSVPGLGLPTMPVPSTPEMELIAAVQRPDRSAQALLRMERDIVVASLYLGGAEANWTDLATTAATVIGVPDHGIVGTVWLYLGKVADIAAEQLLGLVDGASGWWRRPAGIGRSLRLWETSQRPDARAERRFVVLAPADRDDDRDQDPDHDISDELGDWTWWTGTPELPLLVRYLMHMARIRLAMRVHDALPSIDEMSAVADTAVGLARSGAGDSALRAALFTVSRQLSAARSLRRTTEIAEWNAVRAIEHDLPPVERDADPLTDDRRVTEFLLHRLDDDIEYLRTSADELNQVSGVAAHSVPSVGRPATSMPSFGLVTALPEELTAVRLLLDDETRLHADSDTAVYLGGTMPSAYAGEPHTVVVTQLGETANIAASNGIVNLVRSFPTVKCVLMVGIAAGVPTVTAPATHVRLGDIVVASWGIVDYDHVVDTPHGQALRQPHPPTSPTLGHIVKFLASEEWLGARPWDDHIDAAVAGAPAFARPPDATDLVYVSDDISEPVAHPDPAASGHRPGRPKVHYGRIASGDRSLRNLRSRDAIVSAHNVRAIEMEATGIGRSGFANNVEWHVVRGISDYGDTRTDHHWRNYAALVAAAYVKALLGACFPAQ